MTAPTAPAKTKQPGPPLWLSMLVFVIGAVLAGVGGFLAFTGAFEALTAESFELPGSQQRDLEPGEYDVYASTGSITNIGATSDVQASEITVTNIATGETISVRNQNVYISLNRQTTSYVAVGIFTVDEAGTYEIDITSSASERAVVGRSVLSSWEQVRVPLVMLGFGSLLTLVGVVMIVIGIVRRGRAKKAQRAYPGAANWQNPATAQPSQPGFPAAPPPGPAHGAPTAPPAPPPAPSTPQTPTDTDTPWG